MARESEIEEFRRAYEHNSDAQLIHHTYRWIPSCAQHIAAQQLLAERREAREVERHLKIEGRLAALKKPHWSTVPTFALVILGIVVALAAWLSPRVATTPKEEPKIDPIAPPSPSVVTPQQQLPAPLSTLPSPAPAAPASVPPPPPQP